METIKNLFNRFRHSGVLLLIGVFVIIYISFGFLYFQEGIKQRGLEQEIAKWSVIVSNPLPGGEKLREDYETANLTLIPLTRSEVIAILVDIARESGIDVDSEESKFSIPPAPDKTVTQKVGGSSYQALPFTNISVRGDYDEVMAFISALESGRTLKTLVVKKISISQITIEGEGEGETETETVATLDIDLYSK